MKLPTKVTPYKKSILVKFSIVLNALQKENMTADGLYKKVKDKIKNVPEFIDTLTCLYALNKIDFIDGEVLCYVEDDTL